MSTRSRPICYAPPTTPAEKHLAEGRADHLGVSESEAPNVSILILARNEAHNIRQSLPLLLAQSWPGRPELILIDSGSSDDTVQVASGYPLKLYRLAADAFHHARTRNLAAELAQGEYLVYLAADALPCAQTWLAALLRNFADSTVGAVYGRHVARPDASIERRDVLDTMYGPTRVVKSAACRAKLGYRYYHFSTVNCAIRKKVWQQTGFPQDMNVCEDVAIAARILDVGWKIVYEPDAAVYHSHEFSAARLFRRYFDIGVVYRRLNIWSGINQSMLFRDGLRSVRAKLDISGNHYGIVARGGGICQDAAKFAGLVLGRNERWLPRAVKRRLSMFGLFE